MISIKKYVELLVAGAALGALVASGMAQSTVQEFHAARLGQIPYSVPPLMYSVEALEPHISRELLGAHLARHAAYVLELNKEIGTNVNIYLLLKYDPVLSDESPETLLKNFYMLRKKRERLQASEVSFTMIWRSALGHFNHSVFWQCMSPKGGGQPAGELGEAIRKQFGSFSSFNEQFLAAVGKQAGDGWVWLVLDAGKLQIETTQNEDCPLTTGREVILGVDLCEHAYRSQYQNRKLDYVKAWFKVVNWEYAAERYRKAEAHPNTAR